MHWQKCGQIWTPSGAVPWAQTHAAVPIAHAAAADRWFVYAGCRDADNKTRIARVVLDVGGLPESVPTVAEVDERPVLSLGEPGTFDDSGAMPSWLVSHSDELRLYYIGWNVVGTVPYRVSIGLAISNDCGRSFCRHSQGPIVDRSAQEPYFATTPCVLYDNGIWRMWYSSCTGWQRINERWEPAYHVKYAESADGITWNLTGISCLDAGEGYAVARPCVFRNNGKYAMMYSVRSLAGYRTDAESGYRFGYAESTDGIRWERLDEQVGITCSETGWDSEMIEYGWIQSHGGETYLLYNGNGFGRSGFGVARLVAE
jgi:hypothetical protein